MNNLNELSVNGPEKFSGVIIKISRRYIFYAGGTLADIQALKEKFEEVYKIIFDPIEEITATPEEIKKELAL